MKIAVIIDIWAPVVGGSQTHVWEIASRLAQNHDCRLDIFTRSLVDDEGKAHREMEEHYLGKLRIIRIGPATKLSSTWGRIATLFSIAWKTNNEDKTQNYDLIHAHSILGGVIGKLASYLTKKPIFFTVHGCPNLDGGRKNFSYYAERFILTKLKYDKVVSVGKSYLSHKNINSNIEIIPNGVDVNKFDTLSNVKKADFFKIIFVGRLDWVKGIDTLIESIKILKKENSTLLSRKKLQVHLVGYGFESEKYKTMARTSGVGDIISFRGKITGEALIREYKSSHLFILPSVCEGQPIASLEAMAAMLPVLTTYAADNSDIITTEVGWKIKERNPRLLADKLAEIIRLTPEGLEKMGRKGYIKVRENHTLDIVSSKIVEAYASLLSNK